MKFIKTRDQFINEAVRVETNRYERAHGKKPRGFGQWAFYFDDMGGEPIWVPKAMSYSDAVKWAKGEAKKAGKEYIYVGESVVTEDKIPGGLSNGMSLSDIAKKHGTDLSELKSQFEKGVKVEMEHTSDKGIAEEIARDHLFEDPKYYDKLETIEKD